MKKAVVIGGGIAGLAAAKVLSEKFHEVTLYEGEEPRQSYHLHVLLKSGQMMLENLFPGILEELRLNSIEIDWSLDTYWENSEGVFPQYESTVKALSIGRRYLNEKLKKHLIGKVNMEKKLISNTNDLSGDLIVIAGGHHFPLERFGITYEEKRLPIHLTYRSFVFPTENLNLQNCKQYYLQIDPPKDRIGGVVSPISDALSVVTLIEHERSFSPCRSYEEFLRIAPYKFLSILKDTKPVAGPFVYRKVYNHRRKIISLPANVIVIGDAVTSFNPVFGQGMTVALKEALTLKEMLNKKFNVQKFQKKCFQDSRFPFLLSHFGSQEKGVGKSLLRFYLRLCQRSQFFHSLFLRQLHSVRILPGKLI